MFKKIIATVFIMLATLIPAYAGQFIPYSTTPCRTFEEQRANVAEQRPDISVIQPMNADGVVIYHQPEAAGDVYVANHFNENGCLDGLFILNEAEYKEYLGTSV